MTERSPSAFPFADLRTAGAIILAASLLSMLMMAHHPSGSSRDMGMFVEQIARIGTLNRFVHGALIALLVAMLFGFAELSRALGTNRPIVRAALVAYAIGVGAGIGAATINGFAVERVAAHYAGADAGALEQLRAILRFAWAMNQSLANLGEVARAVAVVLWSVAILRMRTHIVLGTAGMLVGSGIALALLGGWLTLDVHGMLLAVLGASAWNVALGVQLLRGRLSAAPAPVA